MINVSISRPAAQHTSTERNNGLISSLHWTRSQSMHERVNNLHDRRDASRSPYAHAVGVLTLSTYTHTQTNVKYVMQDNSAELASFAVGARGASPSSGQPVLAPSDNAA